jgi:hypothetical protein
MQFHFLEDVTSSIDIVEDVTAIEHINRKTGGLCDDIEKSDNFLLVRQVSS